MRVLASEIFDHIYRTRWIRSVLPSDYGRYFVPSYPARSVNCMQHLVVQSTLLCWQLINVSMSSLSVAFSWMHLLCNWSMSNGEFGSSFHRFELRNLSV